MKKESDKRKREESKKHQCEVCKKFLSSRCSLTQHKRSVHEKKRSFKCDACSKAYLEKSTLRNHQKRVHVEKKYECECLKFFTEKSDLDHHRASCLNRVFRKEINSVLEKLAQQPVILLPNAVQEEAVSVEEPSGESFSHNAVV